ncbi:MAG: Cj0069 family protein [Dehalococcoidia bacterium]
MTKHVAVVWRGEPDAAFEASGLPPVGRALRSRGLVVREVPFSEEAADDVRRALVSVDAALVWVDPISTRDGRNRAVLDELLRDVATRGVWVSAHPDAILKLGTKDVLVRTKSMEWGSDCALIESVEELEGHLKGRRVEHGPVVFKRHRGNGGDGVWRVEVVADASSGKDDGLLRILHARRGSNPEDMPVADFVARCGPYFERGGCMVSQPFQERLSDGQIRCYMVNRQVSGFGHHYVGGLLPRAVGEPEPRNPRLYYGPSYPEFQALKLKLEGGWVDEMLRILDISGDELPVLWDADFFFGVRNAAGEDTFVLCEINASSVDIFPGETLTALADAVRDRVATP